MVYAIVRMTTKKANGKNGLNILSAAGSIFVVIILVSSLMSSYAYAALHVPPPNFYSSGTLRETKIILNDISDPVIVNSTFAVSGRLVDVATNEGIDGLITFSGEGFRGLPNATTMKLNVVSSDDLRIRTVIGLTPDPSEEGCDIGSAPSCDGNNLLLLQEDDVINLEGSPTAVKLYVQGVPPGEEYQVEVTTSTDSTFVAESFGDSPHITILNLAAQDGIKQIKLIEPPSEIDFADAIQEKEDIGLQESTIPKIYFQSIAPLPIAMIEALDYRAEPPTMLQQDFEKFPADIYGTSEDFIGGDFYSVGIAEYEPSFLQPNKITATFAGDSLYRGTKVDIPLFTEESARISGSLGIDPSVTEPDGPSTNDPPIADAGEDQMVEAPEEGSSLAYLDGSHSFDPEGSMIDYTWQLKTEPAVLRSGLDPTGSMTDSEFNDIIDDLTPRPVSNPFDPNDHTIQSIEISDRFADKTLTYELTVRDGPNTSTDTMNIMISEPTLLGGAGEPASLVAYSGSEFTTIACGTGNDDDGDSICDTWEDGTIEYNGDSINLCTAPYSDVYRGGYMCPHEGHKDMYLEIDYYTNHSPDFNAVSDMIQKFDLIPNSELNPPNTQSANGYLGGITLHVLKDDPITEPGATGAGHDDIHTWTDATATLDDFVHIKSAYVGPDSVIRGDPEKINAHAQVFHYTIMAHSIGSCGPSGAAETRGNDIVITLGCGFAVTVGGHSGTVGSTDQQEGTLMHELGHNLNLKHGGNSATNCKPNYVSVMSYSLQFNNFVPTRLYDYSRADVNDLVEAAGLSEAAGIAYTPPGISTPIAPYGPTPVLTTTTNGADVNWDRASPFPDTSNVSADTNNLGISGCGASSGQTLTGYDDWSNIIYDLSEGSAFDGLFPSRVITSEITPQTYKQILERTTSIVVNYTNTLTLVEDTDTLEVSGFTTNAEVGDIVRVYWDDDHYSADCAIQSCISPYAEYNETTISPVDGTWELSHVYSESTAVGNNSKTNPFLVIAELRNGTENSSNETDYRLKALTRAFSVDVLPGSNATSTPPTPSVNCECGPYDQIELFSDVSNNLNMALSFVVIVEVRDSDGVTQFLAFQGGTLDPNETQQISVSWMPESSGDYTTRSFVISDLTQPMILSPIQEGQVEVKE
jgi:hypothetical protein